MTIISRRLAFAGTGIALVLAVVVAYSMFGVDRIYAHIGKPYAEVVKDSSFPVERKTVIYPSDPPKVDSTWISSPVVITFDDPEHGFTLPKTIYGAVGYTKGKVDGITTSPMVESLPFDKTAALLDELQTMFRNANWTPEPVEGNDWIKVQSDDERRQLQAKLFDQADGVILLVPHKYSLLMHIKCYARCDERNVKTARYLIDVGLSRDHFSD
ncbi:hypothetical protein BK674_00415 [Pseudomonas moraviensis]|uniref:Flagellar biosynthesis sigma factor n=1 Tax=Pseudomonas moraviensis TaxID=321662 RepID=A0A423NWW6_9PSED|nr:hypothetical protein [Pseudomonas moraviensis]ROO02810.1 hypothetical protein BK674_00415 [Pseudomonas moraviensis]